MARGTATSRKAEAGVTLVELLVVIIIMSIVSTMILGTWFSLSSSYARATESGEQRDDAQMAMERLTREIRDVQQSLSSPTDAIVPASLGPYRMRINTTFNAADASDPVTTPRLVEFQLNGGTLTRRLAGPDREFGTADDTETILVRHVVNVAQGADLFEYYYYNGAGDLVHSSGTTGVPTINTDRIQAIKVSMLVDLNPGKSPESMKITNMVQPRNLRVF